MATGMDRIRAEANHLGWTTEGPKMNEDHWVERFARNGRVITVRSSVMDRVTNAWRSWGSPRKLNGLGRKADVVLSWLAEPEEVAAKPAEKPVEAPVAPAPAESTPPAEEAPSDEIKVPANWDRSPGRITRDLRVVANRLQGIAAELDHTLAMHSLAPTGQTLEDVKDQLEVTSEGIGAMLQVLESVSPMVLNIWLELAYGSEFARKYRKASRMVEDDLR